MAGKGKLTDEDRALWNRVRKSVKPLNPETPGSDRWTTADPVDKAGNEPEPKAPRPGEQKRKQPPPTPTAAPAHSSAETPTPAEPPASNDSADEAEAADLLAGMQSLDESRQQELLDLLSDDE